MTDSGTRFSVVGGTDVAPEPEPTPKVKKSRPRRVPMKDQLIPFRCTKCSEELGYDYDQMVQVLRNPHEANGKLVAGGLWWACDRCRTPYYLIRLFGSKR
jgi:hypothetical protein